MQHERHVQHLAPQQPNVRQPRVQTRPPAPAGDLGGDLRVSVSSGIIVHHHHVHFIQAAACTGTAIGSFPFDYGLYEHG